MKDVEFEEYTWNTPPRESRVTTLKKIEELNVTALTPDYKLKLTKKGKVIVKWMKLGFSVDCRLTVELKAGIRMHEIWQSGGIKYRVVAVDNVAQDALLISTGEPVAVFDYPDTFLFVGSACVGEGTKP